MRRFISTLLTTLTIASTLHAMDYETARREALYLTDKMAYELNLNDSQYNDAYEINLDYLLSLNTADDLYGTYLNYRLTDFRHLLFDWQWNLFYTADYFLRPVWWRGGRWFYPIYSIYDRGYFYFDHPHAYLHYHGGHGHAHFHDGFYMNRRPHWEGGMRGTERHAIRHEPGRNGVRSNYTPGRGTNGPRRESAIRVQHRSHDNSFGHSSTRSSMRNSHTDHAGSNSRGEHGMKGREMRSGHNTTGSMSNRSSMGGSTRSFSRNHAGSSSGNHGSSSVHHGSSSGNHGSSSGSHNGGSHGRGGR